MRDKVRTTRIERLRALVRHLRDAGDIGGLRVLQGKIRELEEEARHEGAAQGEKRKEP